VIRTNLDSAAMDASAAVSAYKSLAHVERAFRSIKTMAMHARPVFHYNSEPVRAHVFLCMLAYTSSGACASVSNRCCLMTSASMRQPAAGHHRCTRRRAPHRPSARIAPDLSIALQDKSFQLLGINPACTQ